MPQPCGTAPPGSAAGGGTDPRHLSQALVCYLEQLEDEEVQTRVAGCAALGCLKVRGMWGGGSRAASSRGRGIACGRRVQTPAQPPAPGRAELGAPQMYQRSRQRQGRKGNGEEGTGRVTFLHRGAAAPCVCLCPALPHSAPRPFPLQAKESIEQLVYLCQTDKEPVREAAKQSLMLCGECPAALLLSLPTHGIPSSTSRCRQYPQEKGVPGWSVPTPHTLAHHAPKLCQARASWQPAARVGRPATTEH